MPEVVTCPKCDKKARVPDSLIGKKVKCPGCGQPFLAQVAGRPAAPPPDEDDEDPGFEVVDEPKSGKPARATDKVSTRPSGRKTGASRSDDEDDEPRRSRRSRRDDDEDDDRPRRRSRRDDDDDDDDDDRPRRRSRRDDDDDDDEDDRPLRKKRRSGSLAANWSQIHRGLTCILLSIVVAFVGGILVVVLGMAIIGGGVSMMGQGGRPNAGGIAAMGGGLLVMVILGLIVSLASLILRILGHFFCLPSPEANGSKTLALITLILFGSSAALSLLGNVIGFFTGASAAAGGNPMVTGGGSGVMQVLSGLDAVLVIAGFFVFLFYLRSLALCLKDYALAQNIVRFMITLVSSVVGLIVVSCIGVVVLAAGAVSVAAQNANNQAGPNLGGMTAMLGGMGIMGLICGLIWVVVIIGLAIWWLVLLIQTRNLVGSRA